MMNTNLLIEEIDLGPVVDDVIHDLRTGVHADLLTVLAEAKLSRLAWPS